MGSSRGSSLLCSTFGKFQSEVFETKERSKVLSALKHRAKAAGTRRAHTPLAPSKFTADDVVRAGILTKQGSWRRNWKTVSVVALEVQATKATRRPSGPHSVSHLTLS